jgi:hypothetical protein
MTDTSNKILAVVSAFNKLTGSPYLSPEEIAKAKANEQVQTPNPATTFRYTPPSASKTTPKADNVNK